MLVRSVVGQFQVFFLETLLEARNERIAANAVTIFHRKMAS
jgi:hypothetical protein